MKSHSSQGKPTFDGQGQVKLGVSWHSVDGDRMLDVSNRPHHFIAARLVAEMNRQNVTSKYRAYLNDGLQIIYLEDQSKDEADGCEGGLTDKDEATSSSATLTLAMAFKSGFERSKQG